MADPYAAFQDAPDEPNTVSPAEVIAPNPNGPMQTAGADPYAAFQDAPPEPAAPPATPQLQPDQGLGFINGLKRPLDNAAVWLEGGLSKLGVPVDAIDKALGMPSAMDVSNTDNAYLASQAQAGKRPGGWGNFAGSALGTLPLMALPGGPLAQGTMMGAASTTNPTDPMGVARDAALGGVGGVVGNAALRGLGAVIAPKFAPAVTALANEDVPLTVGQMAGGAAKRIEDASTSIPILGDAIRTAQRRGYEGFNRAAINRSMAPLNQQLPANIGSGRDAIAYASSAVDDAYDKAAQGQTIALDPQFVQDAQAAQAQVPPSMGPRYQQLIQSQIGDRLGPGATLSDSDFIDAKAGLNAAIKRYAGAGDPDTVDLLGALGDLKASLHGALSRAAPSAADQLQRADAAFSNLATVQNASGSLGSEGGMFTPAQLLGAVKASDTSARKNAFARGGVQMQDLADNAKAVLPSKVPDSGTALRYLVSELPILLGVGSESHVLPMGAAAPAMIGGGLLGSLYTKPGQAIAQAAMMRRPSWSPAVRGLLNLGSGPATAAGGLLGPQAAQQWTQPGAGQ